MIHRVPAETGPLPGQSERPGEESTSAVALAIGDRSSSRCWPSPAYLAHTSACSNGRRVLRVGRPLVQSTDDMDGRVVLDTVPAGILPGGVSGRQRGRSLYR